VTGGYFSFRGYVTVAVDVTEVLKARAGVGESVTVVMRDHERFVTQMTGDMPTGDHLLLLRSLADSFVEPIPDSVRDWYVLDSYDASVFSDLDGDVSVPNSKEIRQSMGRERFSLSWNARPFTKLLEQVRELVQNGRGSTVLPYGPTDDQRLAC
jgi:hypothetical protein